jgi:hypothetical protein
MLFTETAPYAPSSPYSANRGINYYNDVHDWLGGYPYESTSPDSCMQLFPELGFSFVSAKIQPISPGRVLFGSGCDEFIFFSTS